MRGEIGRVEMKAEMEVRERSERAVGGLRIWREREREK